MTIARRAFKKSSDSTRGGKIVHEREVDSWMERHIASIGARLMLEWRIAGGTGRQSIATLIDRYRCTRRSMVSWINRLERWGWIRVHRGETDFHRSVFELCYVPDANRASLN